MLMLVLNVNKDRRELGVQIITLMLYLPWPRMRRALMPYGGAAIAARLDDTWLDDTWLDAELLSQNGS